MASNYRIIITGTTGMVGKSALLYALADPSVGHILTLSRRSAGLPPNPKWTEVLVPDFYNLADLAPTLKGYDAVLHCLGVSAAGMTEAAYTKITHDLTLHLAQTYIAQNPEGGFVYVSGQATDVRSSQMWARVKGATEAALLAMPFARVHAFRPGFIEPAKGVKSATGWYNVLYFILTPFYPLFRQMPAVATTSQKLYRAMLRAATQGHVLPILENRDINVLGAE
jgi:uncharacterized protein YbjT (DUF2867 family)